MKKYLSLILALCLPALLGGCGAVPLPMPESPTPPPAADTEEITYEVSTDPYEQTVTAEDGTTLMVIDFQIPHLQAYANGTLIEDPSTPAQEQAMDRVHTFNENFDQWRESNSSEENISFVKDLYRDMPEMFSEDHMAPLSEELTYTCYRTHHQSGEVYYWILYYSFLSPQKLKNVEEIIEALRPHIRDISFSTYYRLRKAAVEALSSVLWGFSAQDTLKTLDCFFPPDV